MSSFGGTVKLTGESEYRKALSQISSNLKVLNSEMKTVTSQYDKNDKSVENLSSQNDVLNKKLAEQENKVSILKDALAKAKEETGETSETTKKWQTELNNAQAVLNDLNRDVDTNSQLMKQAEEATRKGYKSIDEMAEAEKKAQKETLTLGDVIKANLTSEAIISGVKALADGVASVGKMMLNFGKQVVTAYGELEQNLGGSEAVFGEHASKIQAIGEEAYKNLGLSQSEYLATANKMGALFQGSGIEQQRSLELTSQAMQRAADMASVMGIDMSVAMESVAGAAKGNFTMMDNLGVAMNATTIEAYALEKGLDFCWKTASSAEKAEVAMQMFLDTTKQYDGNFANEATQTVTGSFGLLESAWGSLVAGLGNADADIQNLVLNVIDAFNSVVANVVPIVENIVSALPTAIDAVLGAVGQLLPTLLSTVTTLFGQLLSTILTLLPQLVPAVLDAVLTIVNTILDNLPLLIETASQIVVSLVSGLANALPTLIPAVVQAVVTVVQTLVNNLPMILDAALQLVLGLAQGIIGALPVLIEALPNIITGIVDFLIGAIPMLITAVIQLYSAFVTAIPSIIDALVTELPNIVETIITSLIDSTPMLLEAAIQLLFALINAVPTIIMEMQLMMPRIVIAITTTLLKKLPDILACAVKLLWGIIEAIPMLIVELAKQVPTIVIRIVEFLKEGFGKIADAGKYLVQGLWEGMSNARSWVLEKIKGFGQSILNGIKDIFGIHSPSTVFRDEVGKNLALGVGEGFADTMEDVTADMQGAIPTEFDADINASMRVATGSAQMSTYDMMVSAFEQALSKVKVVMDDREMGGFVTDAVERVVFS